MIRINAVLGKELTTRMRGWRAAAIITVYLAVLAAISLIVLSSPVAPTNYTQSAQLGSTLFSLLSGFQMALITFVTPVSMADAISGERQRQTLDLLLVTRLSSPAIVFGKLLSGLAFDVLLILCSLPLFSLVFLFGGISPEQLISMFVVFLATTMLLGSMAIFISTLMRRSGPAIIVSLLCTQGLTLGLGVLSLYLVTINFASTSALSPPPIPITAYFDPLLGLLGALPAKGGLASNPYFTGGALNLSLWQDQVLVDLALSALFIMGSVRLLRPHWTQR